MTTVQQGVVPSEVGWQFVPQYYTFVNKEPQRLHCFYNKSSTFIHGTEGDDVKPCFGQQEIHEKITSIGFQDCKVFIHSVDAQSSADDGIIIQVIGEMSNRSGPWRKFVQTFFLAKQPNGYFVLNDVFRFLKEDDIDTDDPTDAPEPLDLADPTPVPEPVYPEPTPPTVAPEPAPLIAAPADPEPAPKTNGTPTIADDTPLAAPTEQSREPTPPPQPQAPAPPAPEPPSTSVPTPPTQVPVAQAPTQTPAPAPVPVPQQPRSWASLAATNQKKWGSVAQETRGITEVPSAPASGAQTPVAISGGGGGYQGQQQGHGQGAPQGQGQRAVGGPQRHDHPALIAAQSITTPHCFVRGVTDPISDPSLRTTLEKFGPLKELDIVRSKVCAFIEYQNLDSAKRALVASLNAQQGGGGGVWVETPEGGRVRVFVETKKERSERVGGGAGGLGRGRGQAGGPGGHGAGGGGQGANGGPDAGRGSFRGRGGQRGRGAPGPAK